MAQSTYKTIASTGDTSASSIVLNKPSGVVDGDLMIAVIAWSTGSAFTLTTLSGWTLILTTTYDSGNKSIATFQKIASSEGSSYTWSFSGAVEAMGAIIRIDTHDASSPIATSNGAGTNTGGNTTSLTFADTVTPDLANELILFIVYSTGSRQLNGHSAYAVTTSDPGWTEILDILADTSGAGTPAGTQNLSIAYANRSATSATGNSSCTQDTLSPNTGASGFASQKIVVRNKTQYTVSVADTVNMTDSVSPLRTIYKTVSDTVNMTDSVVVSFGKIIRNAAKNVASWLNQSKN